MSGYEDDDFGSGGRRDRKGGSRGGGSYGGGYGGQKRGPRRDFGPREMHKATCADCGQECEVPFKPAEGREVFCKECYRKKKGF